MTDDLPPHNTPRREDDVLPIPATPQDLLDALMRLDIDVEHHHHPPLYTVEDSKKHQDGIEGGHSKNLFCATAEKTIIWLSPSRIYRLISKPWPRRLHVIDFRSVAQIG